MQFGIYHEHSVSRVQEVDPAAVHPLPQPLFDTKAQAEAALPELRARFLEEHPKE